MCGSSCRRSRNRQQLEPLPAFTAKGSLSPSLSLEKDKIIQQYTKSLDKRSLAALDGGAETGSIAPPTYAAVMESHSPVDIKPGESTPHDHVVAGVGLTEIGAVELIPANPLNAECATSGHRLKRHYGLVGLVGGLMFFPWGLFW